MTNLQGVTIELISEASGDVITAEHFIDDIAVLDTMEKKFKVTIDNFTDTLTLRLTFDPPLKLDDQPIPPEIES